MGHNRERGGGGGFLQSNGGSGGSGSGGGNTGSLKQPSHYTRQAGYSDTPNSDSWGNNYNNYHSLPDRGHKASVHQTQLDSAHSPLHSQSSSVSSPTSSTRESPARGSSLTHITSDVGPLELLASPNLNGNLEDLVSSFVNTDRQKQAARNTISSTLMRRLGSPNGSASPVRSPSPTLGQQPTSPTSSLNYSPLRSPMLASSAQARQPEPLSPQANMFPSDSSNDVHTPMQSIFSKSQSSSNNLKSSPAHHNNSHTLPKMSPSVSDIYTPMQSFFGHGPKPSTNSNFNNFNNGANPKTSPLHINTDRDMNRGDGAIPIPVKHIPINKAVTSDSSSASGGLKSPSVLQSAKQSSVHPLAPGQGPGGDQHSPMPNLFNEFGHVNDAKFVEMRRRFDEAKQRMALSLPAREGGVRPNSFGSMRMFDSPWGDDPSSFLLEQFRRRNKRMMPQMPHSELTPEQKQHISDRGVTSVPSGMRRMMGSRPGGSVAERVLMFEKSPSAFGVEPVQVRVPQRREPQLSGTVITPWRASLHQEMAAPVSRVSQPSLNERIVPINREAAPGQTEQTKSPSSVTTSTLASASIPGVSPIASAPSSSSVSQQPLSSPALTSPSPASLTHGLQSSASAHDNRLLPSRWEPPEIKTFPRRTTQPTTTFRPPSLHLPGKEEIPKFYFPNGNPSGKLSVDGVCKKLSEAFSKNKQSSVTTEQLGHTLKASGYPLYWKCPVFQAAGGDKAETVTLLQLTKTWRKLVQSCHDDAAQFIAFLTNANRNYLVPEDFVPLIQDIVDTHPGLLFLKEAIEFHSRYVHTVIARIFYEVNRSWSGKITVSELRRSKFLSTLKLLQDEDDINQVTDFFSYEHFYVIYCKFWELDKDHDLFIDREDLSRHNEHALSTRMIERIFSGAVTRGSAQKEGRMSYTEFVWFLLAEEDKRHNTAIEYWFRCMDLDGDGVISMYELEYFYEEQLQRMEQLGIETLPFDDCLCQMLDMIRPSNTNRITLQDLKRCKMTPVFFDTFFNLEKYLDHEQRDPFATQREVDEDGNELSDWDRFAADEYEQLLAEEGSNDLMEDMCYEEATLNFRRVP